MEVYLLRHGLAEERSESGDDVHRVLTAAGIRQISHTALVMQTLQIQLGAIVTSPYYRTRQTADLIAHTYRIPPVVDERLSPGFDLQLLHQVLQQSRQSRVLVVAHEPDLSWIVWAASAHRVKFSRGSLARLDGMPGSWQFGFHLSPQAQAALVKFT
jgi:phosphohistidine phosphatase